MVLPHPVGFIPLLSTSMGEGWVGKSRFQKPTSPILFLLVLNCGPCRIMCWLMMGHLIHPQWKVSRGILSMTSGWMTDSDRSCCGIQLLTARVELLDPIQGVVKHNLWGSINSQIHLNLNKYHRNDQILGPLVVPQSGAIGLFSSDWFLLLGVNVLFQGFLTVSRHNFYHM